MKIKTTLLVMAIFTSISCSALNYFWVGGSGSWSDLSHWSLSPGGGVFHNQVPQSTDNVYFDANSFNQPGQIVTIDQTIVQCADMSWTGVTNTPIFSGDYSNTLRIYGSLTLAIGMTNSFNGQVSMEATVGGKTIATAGQTINNTFIFNGIGGEWILQDALTLSDYSSIFFYNGNLNTNNQTVNVSSFESYSSAYARTLTLGSSLFNFSARWYIQSASMMTINAGTSTISGTDLNSYPASFLGGGFTYYDVSFSGSGQIYDNNTFHTVTFAKNGTIFSSNTYDNLNFHPGYTYILPAGLTQTIITSFNVNGNCGALIGIVKSSTLDVQASIAKASGNVTVSYVTLKDINATGGASFTANNSLDLGNNTGWTINTLPSKNLYWVGNAGNWGDGNHWSNISGGAPAGCSPTPVDNVFFDANSFSMTGQTVTVNVPTAYCNNMNWTGVGNSPALYGDYSGMLKIYGSLTLSAGMNFNYIGPISFEATTGGKTIITNGNVINTSLTFNGIGGEWTLQDALTLNDNGYIHLNNGTLNTNNQTVNANSFASYTSSARTLIMGSSTFNLSGDFVWHVQDTSGMTINAGTSLINSTTIGMLSYFYGAGLTYNDVFFASGATLSGNNTFHDVTISKNGTINGSNTFDNLIFSPGYTYILPAGLTQTINTSLNVNGNCGALIGLIKSSNIGSQASISKASGTVTVSYATLKDINATGGATFIANNAIDLGNNTGWTINAMPSKNLYWVSNGGNWGDGNHWSATSGGAPSGCSPTAVDNVFFDVNSFSLSGQTVTVNVSNFYFNTMNWTGVTNTPALYGDYSSTMKIYGSLTLAAGMNFNYIGPVNFEATTTGQTINTAGKVINAPFIFNGIGGGWTLQNDLTLINNRIELNNGILNTNNQTVKASDFQSSTSFPRTLILGSSTFNFTGYWITQGAGMTMNAGTSTIVGADPNGNESSFYGGGFTYNDAFFAGDAKISQGNIFNTVTIEKNGTILGSNTFDNLVFSPGYTYTLPAGQTLTVGNICAQGNGALPIRIQSGATGNPATISKASGTMCWDYVRVSDINATGGATFNAGLAPTNSEDMGGNTGLLFTGGCIPASCPCTSPSITSQPGNSSVCTGNMAVFEINAFGTGLTYQWQVDQGAGFTNLNNNDPYSGVTSKTLNITSVTTAMSGYQYRCVLTGTCAPISTSNAVTLTVNQSPTIIVNSATICAGETATLTASGAASYFWMDGGGSTTNSITVSPILTTSYMVMGTTGACAGMAFATVTVNPVPIVTANTSTICSGQTAILTASGAVNYVWSIGGMMGDTTNPISVSPLITTSYTVTGTTNGCSNTAIANVTVNPVPMVTALVSSSTVTVSATGGTPPYFGTGTFTGLAPGNYSYSVTDANGCVGSTNVTITEPESNCVSATPFTAINSCLNNNTLNGSEMWFSFIAGENDIDVNLFDNSPTHDIATIDWYEGLCTSLILRESISKETDSTISFIADSLTNGNMYFIRIVRTNSCISCTESLNFDLCLKTLLTYVCNPTASCNLIQNPGFELGTPPVTPWGIRENYADCWTSTSMNGWNTPDLMDLASNCSPPSACYTGTCYEDGGVGIPYNYYSDGTVYHHTPSITSTTNRYGCMYPSEGIRGTIFPAPLNTAYYIEFWTATSACYNPPYPATSTFTIGGVSISTPIPGSGTPQTLPVEWSKTNFCIDLTNEGLSSISNFSLIYSSHPTNNKRYFFDDFKMEQLAEAGADKTICSGASIILGPACPSSAPNVTYSWAPQTGLNNPYISNPTASPTSTTNYTVTVTSSAFECIGQDNVTITVNPLPNVTISVSPNPICYGETTILSANGGMNYVWSPNVIFTNINPVAVFPLINTTYSVTGTDANGCSKTVAANVIVNPIPIVTATPTSQTICAGNPTGIALTSSVSNTTFNWVVTQSGVSGAVAGSGSNIIQTLLTTGTTTTGTATYTITPIANGCSGTPITVTVTVKKLPTVTVNSATICSGQTAILTASGVGAVTYTWSNGATTNSISVSPVTTTTYTVTGTSNGSGNICSKTAIATVTVTTCPPECSVPLDYDVPPGSSITTAFPGLTNLFNKTIRINGTFTVDNNFNFKVCTIIMTPDANMVPAKIIVANGATLIIEGSTHLPGTHIYGCPIMWSGIEVMNGASIIVRQGSCIEDALSAVKIKQGAKGTIINSVFNRNLMGVELTQNTYPTSPVTIQSTIFTSRNNLFGIHFYNFNSNSFWNILTTYAPANLKAPYTDIKGLYGINATNVKTLNVGVTSAATSFNGFDAIMCGINLTNTTALIYNNKFQNLLGIIQPANCVGCPPLSPTEKGYGIKATGTATGLYSITAGGTAANRANSFTNTYTAIFISKYKVNNIIGNSITNTRTGPNSFTALNYGSVGIYVSNPAQNNIISISNQTLIKNCETGIWVNRSSNTALHTIALKINDNYHPADNTIAGITADPPSPSCPNCHCTNGIYITDLLGGTATLLNTWQIKTNTITEAANGINLLNVKKPNGGAVYNVTDNICGVRYTTTGNTNGIVAKGCSGISLTLNHTKCSSTAAALSSGNILTYGIYLQNSTNMLLKCNKMDDAARSMVFQGTCTSVLATNTNPTIGITQNTMNRAQDGFVLLNSGIIGTQGSAAVASNNYWTSVFSNSQTFTELHFANTSSKLFMNSGSSTFPTINKTSFLSGTDNYLPGFGLNTSSGTTTSCEPVRALILSNDPPNVASTSSYSDELTAMEEDTTQLPVYSNESHWMRKHFVYHELKNDPSLNNNNSLQNFYNSSNHNYAKFAKVEDKIANGQYNAANAINNTIVTNNVLENNQQTLNILILKDLISPGYIYTSSDTAILATIANQCPLAGGYAVYQARNLLMTFADNVIEFADNCTEASERAMNSINTSTDEASNSFKIYPNPNDGNMVMEYSINATDISIIRLYDVAGKIVDTYALNAATNKLLISNTKLNDGIYFYQIVVNNKIVKRDKLIITK